MVKSFNQKFSDLKLLLDEKVDLYNTAEFISTDPISIPHQFSKKEDIEIVAFIVATISWGNRTSILKNGDKLLHIMGHEPFEFVKHASSKDLRNLKFVHRTFNSIDLDFFIRSLRHIYKKNDGLESGFGGKDFEGNMRERIIHFRKLFFETTHELRSEKHISSPISNSACKRLNMFLRWMVRSDKRKVDFGIWKTIKSSELYLPLDIHTGRIARELGLLNRKQNDWRALEELMSVLKKMDATDPVKYDFALFGIGVNEFKRINS